MSKPRLNQYQYAWIRKLKSGTTRKCRGKLISKNSSRYCCLGVGAAICEDSRSHWREDVNLIDCRRTVNELCLHSVCGRIITRHVSDKWKRILDRHGIITDSSHLAVELTQLNDDTHMSHKEIGRFIDENRKAVFTNV